MFKKQQVNCYMMQDSFRLLGSYLYKIMSVPTGL